MILRIAIFILLTTCLSNASTITTPNVFQTNDTVTNVKLNGNQNAITNIVNGGLDNTNANTTSGYRFYQTVAALPASGSQGAVYFLTSDNSLNFDTGSSFTKVQGSGTLLPSGAAFFMFSGSCPSGTTDITATYSNKFVKINATQLTSSGVVLTATTDSHTLTTAEIPAIVYGGASHAGQAGVDYTGVSAPSTGGATGHTHTISSATTLEPSSITAKLCQVN